MTEKGYSWPEAILTLMILMMVFGTLLPFASKITYKLEKKKIDMIASETALQGIILQSAHGVVKGVREVNSNVYEWNFDGYSICVSYLNMEKVNEKCVTP